MQTNYLKTFMNKTVHVATVLLLGAGIATAQQQINLAAGATNASLPDGTSVPMWGYTCGAAVGGSTATCAASNPSATAWSPIVIRAVTGSTLQINLTNNLSFANSNSIPTSIMIAGQLGGGLGDVTKRTTTPSPSHSTDTTTTWPIAGAAAAPFTPPAQGARVRSFGTEVTAGQTVSLTWNNLRAGTYLLESGTHPSIQVPMGLYGVLIVTNAPAATAGTETAAGTAYPGIAYDADVPMVFGEIDPVQNNAVSAAVSTLGFSETKVWSGQVGGCGNPASTTYLTCYPPVVNYSPLYYLINGVAFNRSAASASLFSTSPAATIGGTGKVLVRLVNAGSHMHVPSIVNSTTTIVVPPLANNVTKTMNGMGLIAEDGNLAPGVTHVQNEVFMAAGKTFDVMVNATAAASPALAVYDRELSLSANKINRDAGMLAYVGVNSAIVPITASGVAATANADTYNSVVAGQTLTVSDSGKGVIANDINIFGVKVLTAPTKGTLTLNPDGTFTYVANVGWTGGDSFQYCGNGAITGAACATVTLGEATLETASNITVPGLTFNSKLATYIKIPSPGLIAGATDAAGYPLTVVTSSVSGTGFATLLPDAAGGFTATVAPHPGASAVATFTFQAQNSQGVKSSPATLVTVNFPAPNGPAVTVKDPKSGAVLTDYRWIIEEDRTFYQDPNCTTNPPTGNCISKNAPAGFGGAANITPILGTNFHTSDMPYVAQGCTGSLSCEAGQKMVDPTTGNHVYAICDEGNGVCRPDPNQTTGSGKTPIDPDQITLDPTKRYYISVLPGDAANDFNTANTSNNCANGQTDPSCGHTMGGAPVSFAAGALAGASPNPVTVLVEQAPFPTAVLSLAVFEDDFPLNGEQDAGGGVDALSPQEPGLGDFNVIMWDAMGGSGDFTGQMTYDMFNQPLSNSLDGTIDPATGLNSCAITKQSSGGITGTITVCPKYESDGKTRSPLAGQGVVKNLMPGRYSIQAIPGADRIARGENWLQTNTLDGQKAHDSFLRIGEPSYFQEFGPASYHVNIGFANPAIINARLPGVCGGTDVNVTPGLGVPMNCGNTVMGKVTLERMSRTPDERLYSSGSHDELAFTQCYISVGDPDGEDFAFTTCDKDGNFKIAGLPTGSWRLTTFDQWNDVLVDGLSTPIGLQAPTAGANLPCPGPGTTTTVCDMGDIAATQWQADVYTRTFIDKTGTGVSNTDDPGIPLINTTVRYRDGSMANNLATDMNGTANFNETFPLFNWYVVEADTTRYKNTGTHTVYDAGGPADGSVACGQPGYPKCGTSTIGHLMANTYETTPLPALLSVPGSIYCADADCSGQSIQTAPTSRSGTNPNSTGRIDNPWFGGVEGWQGFSGQSNFIEFGKEPYVAGENGGIKGHVVYASTRPFDDPQMLVQTQWESLVPHVTMNLYQEGFAADGVTPTLTKVDTTSTTSWDDYAQGFHLGPDGITMVPNMNCPGQITSDLFYFSLYNQPEYLDLYSNVEHGNANATVPMPFNAQYKCYDGMHNWNELQPAVYDGMYSFPSVTSRDPISGKPNGTNCTICQNKGSVSAAPTLPATDLYYGLPQLPVGKYVVEVVPPQGYEIVKEEDKNILIGDNFIAPANQEFGGLGDIFIIPDQAQIASGYNQFNAQNPTNGLGAGQNNGIVPGFTPEPTWPCVGETHIVPDYISLFPQSAEVAPFAGSTRHLCDRKEVTLNDQAGAIAKFYIYTSVHKASKFTGVITDDFTSEFDPFSPQFGEKFAPANVPISVKDWTGAEISRVYSDWWGDYDGMVYSTWEVNPPNPTGYAPNMMVMCMNDKGPIAGPNNTKVTDPLYQGQYSQFCYELPFMPGQTDYLDTPVVPTAAFSAGYNHPDCNYPDATPAIARVDGDGSGGGPWASAPGKAMTITALGDQTVNNYGFSGPAATTAPFNQKTITRHYGFGACSLTSGACTNGAGVTIGGVKATIQSWSDTSITITVPTAVAKCTVQQQAQFGGPGSGSTPQNGLSFASCGELVITAATGQQSIDAVNITIGGKAPTYVGGTISPMTPTSTGTLQQTIDAALPGDLIIVPPGTYSEMLLMWKPVRLQGVGAATTTIDANTQPAGKMDPWRRQVACLFGIAINGTPISATNVYDSTSTFTCSTAMNFAIDRLPLEAVVGWDATLNGNLAQLLQEPTLMGAYEGAGITVLGKGVDFHTTDPTVIWGSDTFPTQATLLTTNDCHDGTNPFPSNFLCNPSSIDGLTITDASQGGGGLFVHGWNHNLQIANNRVYGNIGTLSGGIEIGQGEFPPQNVQGNTTAGAPGSCVTNLANNVQQPYCFNLNVNVHNNAVTANQSIGDELFSATPAGAGGVSFCSGSDYYKFNYNWICGNMSTGDGGGLAHLGFSYNGDIEHNSILFNQSLNPTIPTNGGGVILMGTPDSDPVCGLAADADCPPGLSDGVGPNLVFNANLLQGNAAEAGSGGGLRLQGINGTELTNFPTNSKQWYAPLVTNNIIVNNVAGWDGGGISVEDAVIPQIINNTISSNDSTATAGVLFNTLGAPLASTQSQPGLSGQITSATTSASQPAGLVVTAHSIPMVAALNGLTLTCPSSNPNCGLFSSPTLANNVFWQNRSFYIGVGSTNATYQQNIVTLFNRTGTNLITQSTTGQCVNGSSFWDLGVRGDTAPGTHSVTLSGVNLQLAPTYSILTNSNGTSAIEQGHGSNNLTANPNFISQYCNGSRTPPEFKKSTFNVPPGISDATVPNPIFNLTPAATVDEGNNWINMTWGPLSLVNPVTNVQLANYSPNVGSPVVQKIPTSEAAYAQNFSVLQYDFFGNSRPPSDNVDHLDIGAVETKTTAAPVFSLAAGTYHTQQTLFLTDATPGAVIYYTYTTNGTTPTTSSTVYNASTGITINQTGTVEAIAQAPGYAVSLISSKAYIYTPPAPAPSFSLAGGNYSTPQTLILTDTVAGGAAIYYTYTPGGTVPTSASTPYTGPITINKTGIVEAIAYPTNTAAFFTSGVSNKSYTYVAALNAPTINPTSGIIATGANRSITLTDPANAALAGFAMYYTTDGSTPSTTAGGSTHLYSGVFNITSATATTITVKALATATGFPASTVTTSGTFTFEPQLAAPNFLLSNAAAVKSGTVLKFGAVPAGVTIYYTTNGSNPVVGSPNTTVYNPATGVPLTQVGVEWIHAITVVAGDLSGASNKIYLVTP